MSTRTKYECLLRFGFALFTVAVVGCESETSKAGVGADDASTVDAMSPSDDQSSEDGGGGCTLCDCASRKSEYQAALSEVPRVVLERAYCEDSFEAAPGSEMAYCRCALRGVASHGVNLSQPTDRRFMPPDECDIRSPRTGFCLQEDVTTNLCTFRGTDVSKCEDACNSWVEMMNEEGPFDPVEFKLTLEPADGAHCTELVRLDDSCFAVSFRAVRDEPLRADSADCP